MTVNHNLSRDLAPKTAAVAGGVMLIACGALAREILAIKEANQMSHLALTCLPAKLHNRPEQIAPAVREKIHQARADGYEQILVAYAECGTGGELDKVLQEEQVERIAGPHCYAFFSGLKTFEDRSDEDFNCFFLTDFLVRHFDRLVYQGLGLDRHPELRDMYFGNYTRVVYLEQQPDAALLALAKAAAEKLGLDFEHRQTGFGELTRFMTEKAARWQN
jgi:Protein of unknown function (DUF1638)